MWTGDCGVCKGIAVSALNGGGGGGVISCFVAGYLDLRGTSGGALCSVLLTKYCLGD